MKSPDRSKGYLFRQPDGPALFLALILLGLAATTACRKTEPVGERTLTLVYTSEVGGALDPCG